MSFLLQQNGDRLLQETGDSILIEGPLPTTVGPILLIGGVDVTGLIRRGDLFQNPTFSWVRNQRGLLTFDIELNPAKRAEVLWYAKNGSAPILGGFIERREPIEVPVDEDEPVPYCTRVEVTDFSRVYDWCYWSKTYTADVTRKQILTDLVSEKLSQYDISLDPAQADGPTYTATVHEPLVFGTTTAPMLVAEVMKFLVGATAIDRVSPLKVLKVFEAGSEAAPVSITTANRKASRLTWADSTQTPANTVICLFGPSGTDDVTKTWVQAGGATSWVADIPVARGTQVPGVVLVNGVNLTVDVVPGTADYHWDVDTATLSLDLGVLPTDGWELTLVYVGQFPFSITKTTGATPVVEKLIPFPNIKHYAQANVEAENALAQENQDDARIFSIDTLEDGLLPGQLLPIDVPERDAADTEAIVTSVSGVANDDLFWEYSVTAEEADMLQVDPITDMKRLFAAAAA